MSVNYITNKHLVHIIDHFSDQCEIFPFSDYPYRRRHPSNSKCNSPACPHLLYSLSPVRYTWPGLFRLLLSNEWSSPVVAFIFLFSEAANYVKSCYGYQRHGGIGTTLDRMKTTRNYNHFIISSVCPNIIISWTNIRIFQPGLFTHIGIVSILRGK